MGTIANLMARLSGKSGAERPAIVVTPFGFTVGPTAVAWQAVSEIRGYKVDLMTIDGAFLQFTSNGHQVHVGEDQPGFAQLEKAMIAVFPSTADWRRHVLLPAFAECRTLLYRRT